MPEHVTNTPHDRARGRASICHPRLWSGPLYVKGRGLVAFDGALALVAVKVVRLVGRSTLTASACRRGVLAAEATTPKRGSRRSRECDMCHGRVTAVPCSSTRSGQRCVEPATQPGARERAEGRPPPEQAVTGEVGIGERCSPLHRDLRDFLTNSDVGTVNQPREEAEQPRGAFNPAGQRRAASSRCPRARGCGSARRSGRPGRTGPSPASPFPGRR
jgi:hypothetical protein